VPLDSGHRLPEPECHGEVPQVVLERLDHLDVTHVEHPGPFLDHGDLAAERGEHGRVLHADDPRADDDHGPRNLLQGEDVVRIQDGPLVELDRVRPGGPGAGGDDDVLGADQPFMAGHLAQGDGVGVDETAGSGVEGDVVAGELAADDVDLSADHVLGTGGQVGDGDVLLQPVALPVQIALGETGEVEHRLAQRLGGNGAGVDGDPADHVGAVDDGHSAAQLGRGDGGLLATRT
jgi:hypothetical protein